MAKLELINVTDNETYLPQRREMFNDARWQEAKRTFAQVLRQTSQEAKKYGARALQDRMVAGDFPAVPSGYHNGITCIANGGENSRGRGDFSVYDIDGRSYIYEAPTGDLCVANIPDDGEAIYYLIDCL